MIGDSLSARKHAGPRRASGGAPSEDLDRYNVDLKSRRFGVPLTLPMITPAVELVMIQFETVADDASPKVAL